MREIKFRAWDKELKKFSNLALDNEIRDIQYLTDYEWLQYTGLKDKNDEEIYEGDIVETNHSYLQVYYFNGHWFAGNDFLSDVLLEHECNIIGNIYDNPKLVK